MSDTPKRVTFEEWKERYTSDTFMGELVGNIDHVMRVASFEEGLSGLSITQAFHANSEYTDMLENKLAGEVYRRT